MFCGVHYVLLHYSVPGFLGHLSLYLHIDHSMFVSTGSILCAPPEVGWLILCHYHAKRLQLRCQTGRLRWQTDGLARPKTVTHPLFF